MFQCSDCGKLLSSKSRLTYHISNQVCKRPDRICATCHKTFKNKQGLLYHQTHQVCHNGKIHLKLKDKFDQMTREELITELAQMKGKYESLRENPQTVNNLVIFPHAFGQEDIHRVQEKLGGGDFLGNLITHHTFTCIPQLFTKIHNNKQLPEYHNVYSNSEHSRFVMVSDGESFKYRPKKTIIDQIIEDKRSLLNEYMDSKGEQLGDRVLKKYERYSDQIDGDPEFRKNLEIELGGLLLDMKSVIANDERTRRLLDKIDKGDFELSPTDLDSSSVPQIENK